MSLRFNLENEGINGDENGYLLFLEKEFTDDIAYKYTMCSPNPDNAGFDLVANEDYSGELGGAAHLLDLGVRAILVDIQTREPVSYWLCPRSSIYKTGHMMANSVGVIDKSYRGILKAPVVRVGTGPGFKRGERYFQIVGPDMRPIVSVSVVKGLTQHTTERGEGGLGSTGK